MKHEIFEKFRKRLNRESLLNSLLCGLAAGFAALFVAALAFWFAAPSLIWIAAIIFAAVTAAASWAFYALKFRVTDKSLARRLDAVGLEERVITMTELEGNTSYMAERQRRDAIEAVNKVDAKLIKIVVPAIIIVGVCVTAVLGSGMTVVSALSAGGVIDSGTEVINKITEEEPAQYVVTYEAAEGGLVDGDLVQNKSVDEYTDTVTAVAESGYVFIGWTVTYKGVDLQTYEVEDTVTTPEREAQAISSMLEGKNIYVDESSGHKVVSISYTAYFTVASESEGEGDGEGGDGEGEPSDSAGDSSEGGDGEGEPGDSSQGNGEGDGDGLETEGDNSGNGPSGQYEDTNQIIDGETWYGDSSDEAYNEAMDNLSGDDSVSDEDKQAVSDYYDSFD